jgi:hypothetical protein
MGPINRVGISVSWSNKHNIRNKCFLGPINTGIGKSVSWDQ